MLQLGSLAFGIRDDLGRDVCHFRNLNAERFQARALLHFVQERQTLVALLCRHVTVLDPGVLLFHAGELVEVSSEHRHAPDLVQDVLRDGARQAVSVERRRAASQFVDDDQAAFGGGAQDGRRFQHLRHEGRDAPLLEIAGPDPRQDGVADVDAGRLAGHEGTNLRHGDDGAEGANVRRLSPHVRTCDEKEVGLSKHQRDVVRDEVNVFLQFHAWVPGSLQLWLRSVCSSCSSE
mmetsp:Transcript_19520/g.55125  ORF Transcript_19520/g.55125 Transcript_19520/m.55125 type:complete len:234 (-) Transcript_19520:174-875(-)